IYTLSLRAALPICEDVLNFLRLKVNAGSGFHLKVLSGNGETKNERPGPEGPKRSPWRSITTWRGRRLDGLLPAGLCGCVGVRPRGAKPLPPWEVAPCRVPRYGCPTNEGRP